ncbi:MAG TPA: hypothetical protein PLG20_06705 [Candidatus Syntrophosphaera sp.]|jgi:hypothetical protein|nr:hypothetical protein [Candidatus Syntrophosphaera sp.]
MKVKKIWSWAQSPVGDLVTLLVAAAIGLPLAWLGIWCLAALGVW